VLVAFAAETHDAIAHARGKLARKRADLIVVNEVGPDRAFGTEDNAAVVLGADGSVTEIGQRPKEELADEVWDLVRALLDDSPRPGSLDSVTFHPPDTRGLGSSDAEAVA
jgi:phosphopantothenoylcysteine decarboxylase/phosphopantothenate--cysteine ligase